MKTEQRQWTHRAGWSPAPHPAESGAHLVLVFGATPALKEAGLIAEIRAAYPQAQIMGCTTAGEILGTEVSDESVVTTAVTFAHS